MLLSNPLFLGLWGFSNRLPMSGVSIKYGIYTKIENGKYISEMDDGQFFVTNVNQTPQRAEICNLTMRIRKTNFLNFYSFIKSNFGKSIELETDKINPFISDTDVEDVYITRYSSPVRVSEYYYDMQIEFRKV